MIWENIIPSCVDSAGETPRSGSASVQIYDSIEFTSQIYDSHEPLISIAHA